MRELDKKGADIFDGETDESLFTEPFSDIFKKTLDETFEVHELFKKTAGAGDERSLGVIAALIIENRLDRILGALMPDYDKVAERWSAALKRGVLSAMRICPEHIIDCAQCVQQIRNDFAHDLNKDRFDKIEPKHLATLTRLFQGIYGRQEANNKSLREKFMGVAYVAFHGLDLYTRNVEVLMSEIRKAEFVQMLKDKAHQELSEQLGSIENEPEIKTDEGNLIVTRKGGVIVGLERKLP